MSRTETLAMVGTSVASLNLGLMAMFQQGIAGMVGASTAQMLTFWYLLAFVGLYQVYRLASTGYRGWSG